MTDTNIEEQDHNPNGISRHPLFVAAMIAYWIFVGATILKIGGALLGVWDYPEVWLYAAAFIPAVIMALLSLLEELIADAVYEGTKRAMDELLESLDDFPTDIDQEAIAELYNSEPAGRA